MIDINIQMVLSKKKVPHPALREQLNKTQGFKKKIKNNKLPYLKNYLLFFLLNGKGTSRIGTISQTFLTMSAFSLQPSSKVLQVRILKTVDSSFIADELSRSYSNFWKDMK